MFFCVTICIVAISGAIVLKSTYEKRWSDPLLLENAEALANWKPSMTCYSTYRTTTSQQYEDVWTITKCNGCCEVDVFEYKDSGECTTSIVQYC